MVKDMFASSALRVCSVQLPNSFDTFGRLCVSWRVEAVCQRKWNLAIRPHCQVCLSSSEDFVFSHSSNIELHNFSIQTYFCRSFLQFSTQPLASSQAFSANQIAHEINLENDALVFVSLMAREVMFSSLNFSCHIQRVQHDFGEGSPK